MPFIPFPDVPAVPGVPAIFRRSTIALVSELAGEKIASLAEEFFVGPRWGLYGPDAREILVFDTFLGINFKQGGEAPKVPGEKAKIFATDKFVGAAEAIIKLSHSGDKASRNAMLSQLERIVLGTELYDLVMPEITYPSVTPVKYSYERGEKNGASQLVVELTLVQVTRAPPKDESKAKDASGAEEQSNGQTQTTSIPITPQTGQRGTAQQESFQ